MCDLLTMGKGYYLENVTSVYRIHSGGYIHQGDKLHWEKQ